MADLVDRPLDDIIKSQRGRGRGRGRGGRGRGGYGRGRGSYSGRRGFGGRRGGRGQTRGGGFGRSNQVPSGKWDHDKFAARAPVGATAPAKLLISNLDYGVSDSDIQELFGEFGALRKAFIHYDRSGRSQGTANVIYERRADAVRAMKQYNNVPLDGRAMNIELVGGAVVMQNGGGGGFNSGFRRSSFSGGSRGRGRGGRGRGGSFRGRGGRGGRGRGGAKAEPPTQEQLDADLDTYKRGTDDDMQI